VDTYRHFGRLGLGAVFGSKQLKAIAITGETDIPVSNFKDYYTTFRWLYKKVVETDLMAKYHEIGTPINIKVLNAINSLPTKTYSSPHLSTLMPSLAKLSQSKHW